LTKPGSGIPQVRGDPLAGLRGGGASAIQPDLHVDLQLPLRDFPGDRRFGQAGDVMAVQHSFDQLQDGIMDVEGDEAAVDRIVCPFVSQYKVPCPVADGLPIFHTAFQRFV
jgi:hypothetical protein